LNKQKNIKTGKRKGKERKVRVLLQKKREKHNTINKGGVSFVIIISPNKNKNNYLLILLIIFIKK
jgi:uncharacterized membrane protein